MNSLVCPYCFDRFAKQNLLFRCRNELRCTRVPDEALARYQRNLSPVLLPPVVAPKQGWGLPRKATCACGMETTKAICPSCHNELPSEFGLRKSRTVALIGAKGAGKSNYIAVLINELQNRVGQRFDAALSAADDLTPKRYKEEFRRHVYEHRLVVPATLGAVANPSVRYPLIYRMSIRRKWLGLFPVKQVSSMVFFDTAGEDLDSLDVMSTETRYIANSDGLIFLLDPLQIPAVRDRMSSASHLPHAHTDPMEIIARVARLIREANGMSPESNITTPVALAFSKVDAIRALLDADSPLHQASNHDGYFDVSDAERVSASMRSHLCDWVGAGLDQFVQHNFSTARYFGLSSFGSAPDTSGALGRGVAPFRVEDPMLWLFHKLGMIPGRQGNS